jgi:hypothetical protein
MSRNTIIVLIRVYHRHKLLDHFDNILMAKWNDCFRDNGKLILGFLKAFLDKLNKCLLFLKNIFLCG